MGTSGEHRVNREKPLGIRAQGEQGKALGNTRNAQRKALRNIGIGWNWCPGNEELKGLGLIK